MHKQGWNAEQGQLLVSAKRAAKEPAMKKEDKCQPPVSQKRLVCRDKLIVIPFVQRDVRTKVLSISFLLVVSLSNTFVATITTFLHCRHVHVP